MNRQLNRLLQGMKRDAERELRFARKTVEKQELGYYEQGYFAGQALILEKMLAKLEELEVIWKDEETHPPT